MQAVVKGDKTRNSYSVCAEYYIKVMKVIIRKATSNAIRFGILAQLLVRYRRSKDFG